MTSYFKAKIVDAVPSAKYKGNVYDKDVEIESANGESIRVFDATPFLVKEDDIGKKVEVKIRLAVLNNIDFRQDESDIEEKSKKGAKWRIQVAGELAEFEDEIFLENDFGKFLVDKQVILNNLEVDNSENIEGKEMVIIGRPDLIDVRR